MAFWLRAESSLGADLVLFEFETLKTNSETVKIWDDWRTEESPSVFAVPVEKTLDLKIYRALIQNQPFETDEETMDRVVKIAQFLCDEKTEKNIERWIQNVHNAKRKKILQVDVAKDNQTVTVLFIKGSLPEKVEFDRDGTVVDDERPRIKAHIILEYIKEKNELVDTQVLFLNEKELQVGIFLKMRTFLSTTQIDQIYRDIEMQDADKRVCMCFDGPAHKYLKAKLKNITRAMELLEMAETLTALGVFTDFLDDDI